jgi:Nucleotidyl transferase AbiEii toxin, Type IV TA system
MHPENPYSETSNCALHLDILPAAQRNLWAHLGQVPAPFALYGGTAIALRLGHRESIDFDFFARIPIDGTDLLSSIAFMQRAEVLLLAPNTLTARVELNGDPVLISFFGVPALPKIAPTEWINPPAIHLGSLLELGGMKAAVVQKRAEAKDYLDIHALIYQAKISLQQLLAAGQALYPTHFAPESALKALCYFEDGNLPLLPKAICRDLQKAVAKIDLLALHTPDVAL